VYSRSLTDEEFSHDAEYAAIATGAHSRGYSRLPMELFRGADMAAKQEDGLRHCSGCFLVHVGGALAAHAGSFVSNVTCDKAMYSPGNGATISVTISNSTSTAFRGSIGIAISHLGNVITNLPSAVISILAARATTTRAFSWLPPAIDYQGYLISASVADLSNNVLDSGSSAIDVSSDWKRFPRYGYVTEYWEGLDAGTSCGNSGIITSTAFSFTTGAGNITSRRRRATGRTGTGASTGMWSSTSST